MKVLQYNCKTQLMERDALSPGGHLYVLYFRLATVSLSCCSIVTLYYVATSSGDKLVRFFCMAKPVNGVFMSRLLFM